MTGTHVTTDAIEINAAAHCNLTCVACSHNSAHAIPALADIDQVNTDLTILSRWMQVNHVRVLGGEPLLHPDLPTLLRAIRATPIGKRIRLITNGLILADAPPAVWDLVDEVHVSLYPATRRFLTRQRAELRHLAEAHATTVVIKEFDHFRVADRPDGTEPELTPLVYHTCQIANQWRCLTVEHGRIYRCPQAVYGPRGVPAASDAGLDFLQLDQISSVSQVQAWLHGTRPLTACGTCAGSVGALFEHRQERRNDPGVSTDLDRDAITRLLADPGSDNGCVAREDIVWTA